MNDRIYIYCDESCHLENDHQSAMVLAAVACPAAKRKQIGRAIKALKRRHSIPDGREIKWVQVSPATLGFYRDLVSLFFDEPSLGFRGVVVPDKQALDHDDFDQSHDDFYYKMWWLLLTRMIDDQQVFRVFVDIKDTHSNVKLKRVHEVLCNAHYDFNNERIESIEAVRSHDVPLVQLADVLAGVLSHRFRGIQGSQAKQALIDHVKERSGLSLERSTPPGARKFNLFIWCAREVR